MKFPTYTKYKSSDIGWIGDVPEHWKGKRLKYIALLSNQKEEADNDNPMPYIGLENIESWTGNLLPLEEDLVPKGISNKFNNGATLFGKLRPYLAKACNVDFEGLCSSELLVLYSQRYDRRYLLYLLLSKGFISLVDSSAYGAKMPRVSWDFIGNCRLPVPNIEEQKLIANILDAQTSKIGALITKKQELIEKLMEKRTAMISRAVTRGLPPEEAKKAGLSPIPKLKPSGIDWLGDVPEHWDVKRIKHVGKIRYGLGEPPEYTDDGLPFIRATDIKKGKIDLTIVKRVSPDDLPWSRNPLLTLNEILVVRSGAYTGDSAIVTDEIDGCIAGYDMVLSVIHAHAKFVAWVLLSKYMLEGQIYLERLRAAQPHLNAEELRGFVLLLPPKLEQQLIADYIDRETSKIDQMVEKIGEAIERLQEYRSSLITSTVTGKIDVRKVS